MISSSSCVGGSQALLRAVEKDLLCDGLLYRRRQPCTGSLLRYYCLTMGSKYEA
jgi:hypothetical protein